MRSLIVRGNGWSEERRDGVDIRPNSTNELLITEKPAGKELHSFTAGFPFSPWGWTMKLPHLLLLTFAITSVALTQQLQWRLARGTDQVYIAAMDLYRNTNNGPDTLYAMGFTDSADINARHNSIFLRSLDNGETWDSISNMGGGSGAMKVDPSNARIVYAQHPGMSPQGEDLSMSTDGGFTWSLVWRGNIFPSAVLEIDPVDRTTIWAARGPGYLWTSTDHGQSWQYTGDSVAWATYMQIDPTNDSIMWVMSPYELYKSTDKGTSFLPILQGPGFMHLAIDPKHPATVYVAFRDTLAGLWKTTDSGLSWNDANGDLPLVNRDVSQTAINPRNSEEIFRGAGTPTLDPNPLMFRSTDGGSHWSALSQGLPNYQGHVQSMLVDTVSNKLVVGVGAYGHSGVYVCDYPTSVGGDGSDLPTTVVLYPNYPNPFNPRTTIELFLPKQQRAVLDVFNILGEKVSTIVNGIMQSGNHRVVFDAVGIGSGVYIYRLRTPTQILTRKMMVVK
jgi:hypothetical protein